MPPSLSSNDIVMDLLKAFLGNGSVNTVNVQQWKMCRSGRMLLLVARQPSGKQVSSTVEAMFSVWSMRSLYNELRVVASHSQKPVSQGHEVVMERSCEESAVKC
jgi:hypothetical protein